MALTGFLFFLTNLWSDEQPISSLFPFLFSLTLVFPDDDDPFFSYIAEMLTPR